MESFLLFLLPSFLLPRRTLSFPEMANNSQFMGMQVHIIHLNHRTNPMAATAVNLHRHPFIQQPSNNHRFLIHFPKSSNHLSLNLVQKSRNSIHLKNVAQRTGAVMGDLFGDDIEEDDDEDDEEEEDRSLDLLIKFVENVFKKVSKKARKAVKSVLPVPISARLVGFAVNGTLILAFLWILKAFLQVICTLGTVVFTSILLIRGVWTGISYLQETRNYRADDDEPQVWTRTRPAM